MWLDYLDRIGILIFFRDNQELNDLIILNPLWVRDSVYKVLDSPLTKHSILKEEYFNIIWQGYNKFEHQKLLALMLAFKLCYSQIDNQGNEYFILPALLPDSQPSLPDFLHEFKYEIRFKYAPFIPAGTVNKLIVDLREFIYQNSIWKHNCILHVTRGKSISFAHVIENWQDKTVSVKLSGTNITAMYNLIYNELKLLIKELKEIKFLDNLDIEIEGKYKGEFISLKDIRNYHQSEFFFLFDSQSTFNFNNNKKNVYVNKIPSFFISELEKQIIEQYKELLRYRFLKNNERDFKKRINFEEEIELREINIKEIEDHFLRRIKNEKLLLTESEILSQIESIKQSIIDRLDKIDNNVIKSFEIQSKIANKIDFLYAKIISDLECHKISQLRIEEIVQNINKLSKYEIEKTGLEIAQHINYAFEYYTDKLDEKLFNQYEQLREAENWSTKLKLTVPFLSLIGVNLEHEVDVKKYIKWLHSTF